MKTSQFFIKILVENDELPIRNQDLIGEYQIDQYNDVGEFLHSLLHDACNLMMIEVNAESFDGFEVKKKAKSVQSGNSLVLLSKKRDIKTISKCQRQGADYLFFMPPDKNELLEAVSVLYRRRSYWIKLMKDVVGGNDE